MISQCPNNHEIIWASYSAFGTRRICTKNKGQVPVPRYLPFITNFQHESFILRRLPGRLLTGTDFQQHILGLGNIWETFRACTAHSASMCQSINFYSLLLSFLFFRVDTNRFTCLLARSANFACKINE